MRGVRRTIDYLEREFADSTGLSNSEIISFATTLCGIFDPDFIETLSTDALFAMYEMKPFVDFSEQISLGILSIADPILDNFEDKRVH